LLLLVASVTLGAAGFVYAYLPQATVTVYPRQTEKSVTREITLVKDGEPDFVKFQLPTRIIEVTLEEEEQFTRDGDNLRDDFAKGRLTLINNLNEDQELLPKTHLRHEESGVFFLTDEPVLIPAQGSVGMNVTAKEAGAKGDVPAGKFIIDKLPAQSQTAVWATSDQDFTGGVAVESVLTEAELEQATQKIRSKLQERIRGELTAKASGAPLKDDLVVINEDKLERSAEVGSRAYSFSVKVGATARAFVVNQNDLLSLTLVALRASTSGDNELLTYDPESFSLEIKRVDFDRGRALVVGKLTGALAQRIEPSVFDGSNLAGRSKVEAREYFEQFGSVEKVEVEFAPFWVDKVPARDEAVEIKVAEAQ